MLKRFKQAVVTTLAAAALLFPLAVPVMVHAADPGVSVQGSLCGGTDLSISATPGDCSKTGSAAETTANSLIHTIINIFSAVVGIVAVIMIIVGGFKYITSGGNDGNVSTAKNTILYAVIGLVIVALAQIIVRYVLGKATSA